MNLAWWFPCSRCARIAGTHAARTRASRFRRAGGFREPWHQTRTLTLADRCVVRPVDALTTATVVVPFACACDDVRHCCSFIGVIGVSHSREPSTFRHRFHLKPLPSTGITRLPRCRVGGGAPRGRWPPSAAQTVRAVFPHTAFTKTSSRDEDRWRNQRVDPPPARRVQPVGKSPRSLMLGLSLMELSTSAPLLISPSCLVPTVFAGRLPQPTRLPPPDGHAAFTALQVSGRRRRAPRALASVRRSNGTCGFPAYRFHEDVFA